MSTSIGGMKKVGIIYADLRLSNFSDVKSDEMDVKAVVDTGAIDLVIPEHVAIQLKLRELKPREVILANGERKIVKYVGPIKVETMGRDCVTAAAVMGDQVLFGAIPMEAMDMIIHPRTQKLVPNPDSPNIPLFLAK